MKPPTPSAQRYLRTIYNIAEDGLIPRRIRLSERLRQAGPSVAQMVVRLERDGYLRTAPDQHIQLTEVGTAVAVSVTRKHRLAERLLADVLGVPRLRVHGEAARWEHALSEDAERGIVAQLDDPAVSAWGNPIPGLGLLGVAAPPAGTAMLLGELAAAGPAAATVRCLSEQAQEDPALMERLVTAGIVPGAPVRIDVRDDGYHVCAIGTVTLPAKASHLVQIGDVTGA